jgi:hypothetical protein
VDSANVTTRKSQPLGRSKGSIEGKRSKTSSSSSRPSFMDFLRTRSAVRSPARLYRGRGTRYSLASQHQNVLVSIRLKHFVPPVSFFNRGTRHRRCSTKTLLQAGTTTGGMINRSDETRMHIVLILTRVVGHTSRQQSNLRKYSLTTSSSRGFQLNLCRGCSHRCGCNPATNRCNIGNV